MYSNVCRLHATTVHCTILLWRPCRYPIFQQPLTNISTRLGEILSSLAKHAWDCVIEPHGKCTDSTVVYQFMYVHGINVLGHYLSLPRILREAMEY